MNKSNQDVIDILKKVGAILKGGHFVGVSGRHMSSYINKNVFLLHPKKVSEVGKLFAKKFKNKKIEIVVAPAVAGIPLSQWVAYHLSKIYRKEVLSIFTEKTPKNNQIFKRGYGAFVKNKRVLVIEDITTTGISIKKVIRSVKKAKGKVVAVGVMVNRDPSIVNTKSVGVPFFPLAVFKIPSYEAKDCPLCKKGVPINTVLGHGKKFLEKRKNKIK